MKKIMAYGLAALLAAAMLTAASGDAFAKPYWMYSHSPMMFHHHHHPPSTFLFSAPFFFGFSLAPRIFPYQNFYGMSPHVQWCLSHYRTYNPATNLFFIKKGVRAVCVSPFGY